MEAGLERNIRLKTDKVTVLSSKINYGNLVIHFGDGSWGRLLEGEFEGENIFSPGTEVVRLIVDKSAQKKQCFLMGAETKNGQRWLRPGFQQFWWLLE